MSKRFIFIILLSILSLAASARRTGTMLILEQECEYDTVQYRHIAPGTTYTLFQFNNIQYGNFPCKMRVHLITVDLTNPYNAIKPYMSKDTYYAVATQKQEVAFEKQKGNKPIATIIGGIFNQSNGVSSTSLAYELIDNNLVKDGAFYSGQEKVPTEYYFDSDKLIHICDAKLQARVSYNNAAYDIDQINHYRDKAANGITLFCNKIPRSLAADATIGVDVRVKTTEGATLHTGSNHCQVVEVLKGCKNTLSEGEAILSAQQGEALAFLQRIKAGDELDISLNYTDGGNILDVQQLNSSLAGQKISKGKVVNREMSTYAVCALGTSEDGKTAYLADIEYNSSSNVPVVCLYELMADIGVWDCIQMDGGPSAEMTVDGEFVTTNSIGYGFNGRYTPTGTMLYSTAPNDYVLTSVEIMDMEPQTLLVGETFSTDMYGFNQYGEMIDSKAWSNSRVTVSCTEGIGTMAGNVFTATQPGSGYIYVKVAGNDEVQRIPIEVVEKASVVVSPKTLFTGEGRTAQLSLKYVKGNTEEEVSPSAATWSRSNKYVISDCTDGLLTPFLDGWSEVYVDYNGLRDTMQVTVENLEEEAEEVKVEIEGEEIHLPSVPRWFEAVVEAPGAGEASLQYETTNAVMSEPIRFNKSGQQTVIVHLDYDAIDTYPVSVYIPESPYKLVELTAYYVDEPTKIITTKENMGATSLYVYTLDGKLIGKYKADNDQDIMSGRPLIYRWMDSAGKLIKSKVVLQ